MIRSHLKRFFSFKMSNLQKTTKKTGLKVDMEQSTLIFGQDFTSHMAEVDFSDESGWGNPVIKPMESFTMHPACSAIHYSLSCFEGFN
jgi:branched-chain amino acid aminotransferase